jgi:cytidylate kinase
VRVHVTASPETRTDRLRAGKLLDPDGAARAVAESDRGRHRRLRRFFDIDHELPTHYDLVVDTDTLRVEHVVAAIAAVAGA